MDMEWIPGTYQITVVGAYDAIEGYREYGSIEAFLEGELTPERQNALYFAHSGGKYDFQFLICYALNSGEWEVEAKFVNTNALIVTLSRNGKQWQFVDSLFLLRSKLETIGEALGYPKVKVEQWENLPRETLIKRNRVDCEILYRALYQLQEWLWENGGEMGVTLASTAMNIFRRRFLKEPIKTSEPLNEVAAKSYFASRVEVFRPHLSQGEYWDINSSFPHSMCKPMPGNLIAAYSTWEPDPEILSLVDATVQVPDCYLPVLPYKSGTRIFHPTGVWRGVYTSVDLLAATERGAKILKVHRCYEYESFTDMAEYVNWLYPLKANASSPFQRFLVKLMLNSLYGKFGERGLRWEMVINPQSSEGLLRIRPGLYVRQRQDKVAHRHVPISSFVTAESRQLLNRALEAP
jgi:hypothetical protein